MYVYALWADDEEGITILEGIFSTRDKAQACADDNAYFWYDIEELKVDAPKE